jgi:hypothetical protein
MLKKACLFQKKRDKTTKNIKKSLKESEQQESISYERLHRVLFRL